MQEQIENIESRRIADVYRGYHDAGHGAGKWSRGNPGNAAIIHERMDIITRTLVSCGLDLAAARVLEIGCGGGSVMQDFVTAGVNVNRITGVDLLEDRIAEAKERHPDFDVRTANATALPFEDTSFDCVLIFTVFSSILDESMRVRIALETDRVLRRGGAVVWYDFRVNNPANPNVRGISVKSVRSYFPNYSHSIRSVTVFPHFARRLGPLTHLLYPLLASIPFVRTHLVGVLVKR